MADLKLVYAAPTEETALNELELFRDKWDSKYHKIYKSWYDNWATLSTYFKYPEAVRRLIYTTNAIEGFNRQLRKVKLLGFPICLKEISLNRPDSVSYTHLTLPTIA